MSENNFVKLVGKFEGGFVFDFKKEGEKFYRGILAISRHSGTVDQIPIIAPETMVRSLSENANKKYEVQGMWASYIRRQRDSNPKMKYYVLADLIEESDEEESDENNIYIRGHVYSPPFFKITQAQSRKITNIMVRSEEGYLLPCIAWGRKAEFASYALKVGDEIEILGRIQSRPYFKKESPDSQTLKSLITYEISISTLAKL